MQYTIGLTSEGKATLVRVWGSKTATEATVEVGLAVLDGHLFGTKAEALIRIDQLNEKASSSPDAAIDFALVEIVETIEISAKQKLRVSIKKLDARLTITLRALFRRQYDAPDLTVLAPEQAVQLESALAKAVVRLAHLNRGSIPDT